MPNHDPIGTIVKRLFRWLAPDSLAARVFSIYAVALLVFSLTGFGLLLMERFSQRIESNLQEAQKMIDLSKLTLSNSAVIGDFDTIERTLSAMIQNSPLREVIYKDHEGGLIQSQLSSELHAPDWLFAYVSARLPDLQHLVSVGGRNYGQLTLRFDVNRLTNEHWALVLKLTALVLLSLGIGLKIMHSMLKRWLGNFDRLEAFETQVLAGVVNAQADLPVGAPLEIRQAVDVINRTAGSLRAQFGQQLHVLMDTLIQHKKAMDEATMVCELDSEGRLTEANDRFVAAIGLPHTMLLGHRLQDIGYDEVTENIRWQPSPQIWHGEVRVHDSQVNSYWHQRSIVPIFDEAAKVKKYLCIDIDVSSQKKLESNLVAQVRRENLLAQLGRQALKEQDFSDLADHIVEAARTSLHASHSALIVRTPDRAEPYLLAGKGWASEWLGRDMPQAVGDSGTGLSRTTLSLLPEMLTAHNLSNAQVYSVDSMESGNYGLTLAVASRVAQYYTDADHNFLKNMLNILSVAMEKNRFREKLIYLAQYDDLTGLPNRSLLLERLQLALKEAKFQGRRLGLIYLDLDRFKLLNDTFGHQAGDLLLLQAARRMTACLRAGDTVARLSGDEFAILLPDLEHSADIESVARKILLKLAEPFDLNGQVAHVTASIGASIFPDHGSDSELLLGNADRAMYSAKETSRNDFHFYSDEMNSDEKDQLEFDMLLRGALSRDEFLLLYQPKVDLRNGQICGFEALLRWRHPKRGVVGPTEFMPQLEETGMIVIVGEWVINCVAKQIILWQAEGLRVPRVSINLSPRQLMASNLDAKLQTIIANTGIDPKLLEFEITESNLMHKPALIAPELERFRSYGLSISIDDFGTGYSSLAYLKRFPLDILKIDRSFISDMNTNSDDSAIIWAIINLAHILKLKVVAEGVETVQQLDMLHEQGCDEIQGFYFSEPVSADDCALMLREVRCLNWVPQLNTPGGGHWRNGISDALSARRREHFVNDKTHGSIR